MLCRALFAAIVVSYVLCVLLMSGVHKEDLDAQTLRKLQRHNVNISDIDDQKLRDQCFVDNYVSSLTTDRVDLKEHRRSREQPAFVDENGTTKAQLTGIIDYLKNQEKHKKETITKSVVATDTIDLNSLFSLIKNISVHESITEASTDSPPNVTNKDSAKPTLKNIFDYFKKQAENIKERRKTNVHTENFELNPLNTRIKISEPESTITKEQLKEILDDYFKKQDIKDTTSRPVNLQTGTTTKSNIAELSSFLSNKNPDIEFIADSVSHITLKSGKAKDRENISFARKENKSKEINTNKTLPETSTLQNKPQVLNDIEYVSNIVARILKQKQQNQAQTATYNSNEKKHIRDIDTVEDKISDKTTPTSHVLNNYNLTKNVETLDTVEPINHNKQNDLINALLKELRNRDRVLTRYKEETSSNYDQYNIDNQKQLKNSLEEESKGATYNLRGTSNKAAGIFSRFKNRPVIDPRYKGEQPINVHSWNSREEEERKPFNQLSERSKTNMQNTINEYYPESNRHHKRKLVYFGEEREQTPEPTVEMEQKIDIRHEPYNTMDNENDRSLDNAYKPPWQYFSNRRNSKDKTPPSNQKNGLKRQFKSIINTINNEDFPTRERKPKYAWPVYYEDVIMTGNLQLQNNFKLGNKPNELQKPENKHERIPIDPESPLMEPVLSKWFKNKWTNPQSGTSFKKEPKSIEELTKKLLFNNRNKPYQNNDNVFFENETVYDNLKKYLLDEKVNNLKDEIEKKDHTKVTDNNLSSTVLKQIADTVKAIVLEDLKKEKSTVNVISTTPSTTAALTEQPTHATDTTTTTTATTTTTTTATTTTTTATTTTTVATITAKETTSTRAKEEQLQEASKALEQFMKIFENFQLLKLQLNPDNSTNQQNLDVVKVQNFQVFKPLVSTKPPVFYDLPQVKMQKDIILDPFTDKEHWMKMQNPSRYPVMFQTNSNEIPPLRLPLGRPVLFNTVLLTTRATPLRYDQPVDTPDNPPRPIHKSVRVAPYTRLKPEQSNNNDGQPRGKYEESFKPRHIGNHIGNILGKDYFHNVKKIHENIEDRPPTSKKCTNSNGCPDRISQRKQRPLSRGSNFDDKHFKNFLKTQQKVNAMLERILATKAKRNHPMSTEII